MTLYWDWFRLARELGIPLESCIRSHTVRQRDTCLAILDRMQDIPGTVESYLMQVAMEVAKTRTSKPNQVKLSQFRLKFVRPEPETETTKQKQLEQILATKKQRYRRMGGK